MVVIVSSLFVLVQFSDSYSIERAFDGFAAVPEILSHERPDHVERRDCRITAPEFLVPFPGSVAPRSLWKALLKARKQSPRTGRSAVSQDACLRQVQDSGDDAHDGD